MKKLIKDYTSWLSDNKNFYDHLKNHESILFHRFQPVLDVLYYLYDEYKENSSEFNDDIEKIFQVGLEYINMQFFTCKLYLHNVFSNDFHIFLFYEQVINYILFLEDLEYELVEKTIKFDKNEFDKLAEYLDNIIEKKSQIPENLNLYVDSQIHKLIDEKNYHFKGIIDIFVEIGETLGIDFDEDIDYIVGKEI
jgi:hypothetical protein